MIIPTDSLGENPKISDHFARVGYLMIIGIHGDNILDKTFVKRSYSKPDSIRSRK